MHAYWKWWFAAALALAGSPAHAALNVFATVPESAALTEELGGDKVKGYMATSALQDPHHIEAKPNLIARWEREAAPLKGAPVLVQHKGFTYLIAWLGMKEIAALEPKPGVEPTIAYLSEVLATVQRQPVKMVLRAAYQSDRPSQWIAER